MSSQREGAVAIVRALRRAGREAFFVGGCVRDLLRGEEPDDYDVVTSARPEQIMEIFPKTYPVGAAFGVILVREGGHNYEVAAYRKETDYRDGRHPSRVSFATAREDVYRRDFTVNGLLMDPETGEIVDYVGGRADLEKKVIRTIGPPEERFAEDHLRMLRAVRFAANLGFLIEKATLEAIRFHGEKINRVSAERLREELGRILTGPGPRRGMELLAETGLLTRLLPEVAALRGVDQPPRFHPEGDVWEHTLRMLALLPQERIPREGMGRLAWAVLFHDAGKPATRTEDEKGIHFYGHVPRGVEIAARALKRLKFSREDTEAVLALVANHMRFMHVREMRPHTLKKFLRQPDFELHLALHRLDCLGSHGNLDNEAFCRGRLGELTAAELPPPAPHGRRSHRPGVFPRSGVPEDPGHDRRRPTPRRDHLPGRSPRLGQEDVFANCCRRRSWMRREAILLPPRPTRIATSVRSSALNSTSKITFSPWMTACRRALPILTVFSLPAACISFKMSSMARQTVSKG
ncbi:MAG TPA: CCA tRNA nucleotidyltransferase [Syntrophales bacterium]|nr:CCA tRNA nucleotidyltransferase [Syntrophales bacterium]